MARNKHNNADEDERPMRFENCCYLNFCHHNTDKRRIPWKDGVDKSNKALMFGKKNGG